MSKRRISKYDIRLFFDSTKNRLIKVQWDTAYNGIPNWFHYDGNNAWWEKGNGYLELANKKWDLIDIIHEGDRL